MKLCHAVKACPGLTESLQHLSLDSYHHVTNRLCEYLRWHTPCDVANRALTVIGNLSDYNKVKLAAENGQYGSTDVPLIFYLAQQQHFLTSKVQCPHFFCWPGVFLTSVDEDDHASAIMSLLSDHMPPFQSSSLDAGVDTINVVLDSEAKSSFVSNYFATQVLYDLSRQWISAAGNFSFDYHWKGNLATHERATLKERFHATFELNLDDIAVHR